MWRYALLMVLTALLGSYSTARAADTDITALEHVLDQWGVGWSSGDPNKLLPLFTADIYYEDVTMGAVNRGQDALRKFAMGTFEAWPGSTFEVKSRFVAASGKWGAIEWVWHGRQSKDVPGLRATNTPFELRGSTIIEFSDGKISRNSDYWDLVTYMKRVGLTK
jgi:steroid delta-isomerase-like uncharacterized protein